MEVQLSKRSQERIAARIVELTPRNWGGSMSSCIRELNVYLKGWLQFFRICTGVAVRTLSALDKHIRRRLRAIQLRHWKSKRTIARKLIGLGIRSRKAWRSVYDGRMSVWALSHTSTVDYALRNSHWDARGLVSLVELWREMNESSVAPHQLSLAWNTARS